LNLLQQSLELIQGQRIVDLTNYLECDLKPKLKKYNKDWVRQIEIIKYAQTDDISNQKPTIIKCTLPNDTTIKIVDKMATLKSQPAGDSFKETIIDFVQNYATAKKNRDTVYHYNILQSLQESQHRLMGTCDQL
jgi:hypothetical protein